MATCNDCGALIDSDAADACDFSCCRDCRERSGQASEAVELAGAPASAVIELGDEFAESIDSDDLPYGANEPSGFEYHEDALETASWNLQGSGPVPESDYRDGDFWEQEWDAELYRRSLARRRDACGAADSSEPSSADERRWRTRPSVVCGLVIGGVAACLVAHLVSERIQNRMRVPEQRRFARWERELPEPVQENIDPHAAPQLPVNNQWDFKVDSQPPGEVVAGEFKEPGYRAPLLPDLDDAPAEADVLQHETLQTSLPGTELQRPQRTGMFNDSLLPQDIDEPAFPADAVPRFGDLPFESRAVESSRTVLDRRPAIEPGQFPASFETSLPPVPEGLVAVAAEKADDPQKVTDRDDSFLSPVAGEPPVATRSVSISCSAIQLVDGGTGQLPLDLAISEPARSEGYYVLVATPGDGGKAEFDVTRVVRSASPEAVVSFKLPLKTARGALAFPLQIQIVHRQDRVASAESPPAVEVSNRLVVAN